MTTGSEVWQRAHELHRQRVTWAIYYREILGPAGLLAKLPAADRREFVQSSDYRQLRRWLAELMEGRYHADEVRLRMITIRVPEAIHELLKEEAHDHRTSLNQLAISKLLQPIAQDYVPRK